MEAMSHAHCRAFSSTDLRATFGMFPTGVTIITAVVAGERIAATVSSFNSLSLDPPLLLFSIGRHSKVFDAWNSVTHFAVNILDQSQKELSARFGRSQIDKWEGVQAAKGQASGASLFPDALACFECETHQIYEGGDHIIIIGRILTLSRQATSSPDPLVFFGGNYRKLDTGTKIDPTPHDSYWTYGW